MTGLRFAALGRDHRNIHGMAAGMQSAEGRFVAWWSDGEPTTLAGFSKRGKSKSCRCGSCAHSTAQPEPGARSGWRN